MNMTNKWEVLPKAFLERIEQIIPKAKLQSVLQSFCKKKPTTLRANTLKISPQKLIEELSGMGFIFEKISWMDNCFVLKNRTQRELTDTNFYKDGFLYLQNLSSQLPPIILDPQVDDRILDIAAAPGSKTTQIAAMMENTGEILANDKSRIRGYKLEANLRMQGVTNVKVSYLPGQAIWKRYPEYFDKSLVDVPCSLEGTFRCDNPKSYENWSVQKVKALIQTQRYLLRSAVSATRVGGIIVYSTCTLAPEENEGIVDWILNIEKDRLKVEEINIGIGDEFSSLAVLKWKNKMYDPQIKNTLRVLPNEIMEGFFVAKLRKIL